MKIKLFTMVKNEDDIVEQWIQYHGKLFGYNNLSIVDMKVLIVRMKKYKNIVNMVCIFLENMIIPKKEKS